jgi:hypothetical protein
MKKLQLKPCKFAIREMYCLFRLLGIQAFAQKLRPPRKQAVYRMKFSALIILAAALLSGCRPAVKPTEKPAWQYLNIEAFKTKTPNTWPLGGFYYPNMDDLGNKGWELVSATPISESGSTSEVVLTFKRRAGSVPQD